MSNAGKLNPSSQAAFAPERGAQQSSTLVFWLVSGVVLSAALTLYLFKPGTVNFYPTCLFHQMTGLLCPGCGSLRSAHELMHGHLLAAARLNPLFVASLPLLAWFTARRFGAKLRNENYPLVIRPVFLWSAFLVLLMFGVLRNLPYPAFRWMAP